MKQATDLKAAQLKAQQLAQHAAHGRLRSPSADSTLRPWHSAWGGGGASAATASSFKPFARDPEKQKRYEEFLANVKRGQKGACEGCAWYLESFGVAPGGTQGPMGCSRSNPGLLHAEHMH